MAIIPVNFYRAEVEWRFDDLAEYARVMEDQIARLANSDRMRLEKLNFAMIQISRLKGMNTSGDLREYFRAF